MVAQIVLDLIDSANAALRKAFDYMSDGKRGTAARYCLIAKRNIDETREGIPAMNQLWTTRLTNEANRSEKILWQVSRAVLLHPNASGYYTAKLRRSFVVGAGGDEPDAPAGAAETGG